ncbi:hypothetical protein D5S18_01835 [Nocardia panacis]|uniref:Uncharacterized protein n=1 Tax=Nocardia panacis TaxID=2340916 RepID=A0A3A4L9T3_9NOCA|nr:hypothetical protein [Nocardia panacis]RJO80012.1 hypothetical protein D5S18_01835 [Nocardia panacis]
MWLVGAFRGVMAALVLVVGVTGCGGGHSEGSRGHTAGVAETVKEAAEFGGLVIPAGVTVLDARFDRGIDMRYRLALSTEQQGLTLLLKASNFVAPLAKADRVIEAAIAGPPLDTSPSILQAGDVYWNPDKRRVHRVVTVDERDATTRFVHVELYTT